MKPNNLFNFSLLKSSDNTSTQLEDFLLKTMAALAAFPSFLIISHLIRTFTKNSFFSNPFSDYRVGQIVGSGSVKVGENLQVITFGIGIFLVWLAVDNYLSFIKSSQIVISLIKSELIVTLPLISKIIFGGSQKYTDLFTNGIVFTVSTQLAILFFYIITLKNQKKISKEKIWQITSALSVLCVGLIPISSLGVIVGVRYLYAPKSIPIVFLYLIWIFVVILGIILFHKNLQKSKDQHYVIAVFLTIQGISSLFLLLPMLYVNTTSSEIILLQVPQYSDLVTGLIKHVNWLAWKLLLVIYLFILLLEFFLRTKLLKLSGIEKIPSFAIALVISPLQYTNSLPFIPSDDYHAGENFTPAVLWANFHQVPYIDFYPIRGILSTVVPGLLNEVFNNGVISNISNVLPVISVIVMLISHLLLRRIIGFTYATLIIFLFGGANFYTEGQLIAVSILFFLIYLFLRRVNVIIFTLASFALSAIALLSYPLMGLTAILVLGFLVFSRTILSIFLKDKRDFKYFSIFLALTFLFVTAILQSQIGLMMKNAVYYVVSNAKSNSEVNGIALELSFNLFPLQISQFLALTFVSGIFVTFSLLLRRNRFLSGNSKSDLDILLVALVPALMTLILFNRFLGRIDPSEWLSRASGGSQLILGMVIPLTLILISKFEFKYLITICTGVAFIISNVGTPFGSSLLQTNFGQMDYSAYVSARSIDEKIPRLGFGNSDPSHLEYLISLHDQTQNFEQAQYVLNLTNKTTLYSYFGWKTPIKYLAPYNIESNAAEIDAVKELALRPPDYALVSPSINHDGVSLTLRNPYLASWLMKNYLPVSCGPSVWAVHKRFLSNIQGIQLNCENTPSFNSKSNILLWSKTIGAPQNLGVIPHTWGKYFKLNESEMTKQILKFTPEIFGIDQTQQFRSEIKPIKVKLQERQFLFLESHCRTNYETEVKSKFGLGGQAQLEWSGSVDEASIINFEWGSGKFLVPLDAFPAWQLKPDSLINIKLTLPSAGCPSGWNVASQILKIK